MSRWVRCADGKLVNLDYVACVTTGLAEVGEFAITLHLCNGREARWRIWETPTRMMDYRSWSPPDAQAAIGELYGLLRFGDGGESTEILRACAEAEDVARHPGLSAAEKKERVRLLFAPLLRRAPSQNGGVEIPVLTTAINAEHLVSNRTTD